MGAWVNGRRVSWEEWGKREVEISDPRVQAIRCTGCHRLRQHPEQDDPRTLYCGCGGITFQDAFPHDDEVQLAIRLYSRQIEEKGLYAAVAAEVVHYKDNT